MRKKTTSQGFTLIELLLYVAVASGILLASTMFTQLLVEGRVKNQTIAEVEHQGALIMQYLSQTIRNAESITAPAVGSSATSINLDVIPAAADPTIISASGGTLFIAAGASPQTPLTNTRVSISNVSFHNISRPDTPGAVRISFTLSYVSASSRNPYQYEKTFYGTATLRQP